jgi:hypothetical protein
MSFCFVEVLAQEQGCSNHLEGNKKMIIEGFSTWLHDQEVVSVVQGHFVHCFLAKYFRMI